jgi:hypothetical protein
MSQDSETYEYINRAYGLNVKKGTKLKFRGVPVTVVGIYNARLHIIYEDGKQSTIHPTWETEYEEET